MQPRALTGQATTGKQKSQARHYKRVHEDSLPKNEDESRSQAPAFLCAAAEDDHQGWGRGNTTFDPMYTVNRRNRESDSKSKESFFKKLKVRLENNEQDDSLDSAAKVEDIAADSSKHLGESKILPCSGVMKFGFGMMDDAGTFSKQDKAEKKDKKDKKEKDKKDRKDKSDKKSKKDKKDKKSKDKKSQKHKSKE
ncbi:hypothetical protein IWW50_004010 [Coemansia erecta]|nr:hypothetical protein IWW50_004010 [Coemansia erecta]